MNSISNYKYLISVIAVFNFLLTPVHVSLTGAEMAYIVVVNYSIVILAGSLIASTTKTRITAGIIGITTLAFIWLEFSNSGSEIVKMFRLSSSFGLFMFLCILLLGQLRQIKKINLQFILGPILGFIYLGILGGILFETVYHLDLSSFQYDGKISSYLFYYFSFISITTVGYGDITPITQSAQALTLVMNIIGQFYLAIVIAVFVGKYNHPKNY